MPNILVAKVQVLPEERANVTKVLFSGFTFVTENGEQRPMCLLCNEISKTGMDIFQKVNNFFSEMRLQWKDYVGVFTDAAAVMAGHSRFSRESEIC